MRLLRKSFGSIHIMIRTENKNPPHRRTSTRHGSFAMALAVEGSCANPRVAHAIWVGIGNSSCSLCCSPWLMITGETEPVYWTNSFAHSKFIISSKDVLYLGILRCKMHIRLEVACASRYCFEPTRRRRKYQQRKPRH